MLARMGRYGYMNISRIPGVKDKRVVRKSLERVQMWEMRPGGQKKRAFFAQATVLLLDKPFISCPHNRLR
jgi:manganese transport system ATP-binding protein